MVCECSIMRAVEGCILRVILNINMEMKYGYQ
jgi:hypothetical protein